MRTVGAAFEFGVELAGGEPRVLWQFDDLDEPPIRGQTGRDQPGGDERIAEVVAEFIAVAVALGNFCFP